MLPSRKSLVPRKTFMSHLHSLASALPQVAEDGGPASGPKKQLHGAQSYAPGSAAALSPSRAGAPLRDSSEQLVEVSSQARALLLLSRCYCAASAECASSKSWE